MLLRIHQSGHLAELPSERLALVKEGMLISGGEVNTERASVMLLDEYRGGKLGRISMEFPPS